MYTYFVEGDVHLAGLAVLVDGEEVVGEDDQVVLVEQLGATGVYATSSYSSYMYKCFLMYVCV